MARSQARLCGLWQFMWHFSKSTTKRTSVRTKGLPLWPSCNTKEVKDLDTETDSTVLQHHSKRLNNIVFSCPIFILFLMTFVWIHTFTRCTFFRPLTKLQEGNVFTNVCLSTEWGGYPWSQVPSRAWVPLGWVIRGLGRVPREGEYPEGEDLEWGEDYLGGGGWLSRGGYSPPTTDT